MALELLNVTADFDSLQLELGQNRVFFNYIYMLQLEWYEEGKL